jgi:DHA1 family multidrug resistance protein-like MFS transporter
MEEKLGASVIEVGYAASALGLTGLIVAVPSGILSDRFGRRTLIALSSLLWSFALVLIALSTEPFHVIAGYAIAGIGLVMFDAALSAFVGDISPSKKLVRGYGSYNTAIQIGFTVGPIIGGLFLLQTTYRNTFLIIAVAPILVSLIISKYSTGKSYQLNKSVDTIVLRTSRILRKSAIWIAWIAIFCISFLLSGVSVLIPLYSRINGFSELFIGALFSVQSLTGAFGIYPFANIIDNSIKLSRLISLGLIVMGICTFGFAFSSSEIWLILMMGIFGLGLSLTFIISGVIIAKHTDVNNRGLAMGFGSMFRFAGFAIGPWIGSFIVASQSNVDIGYSYGFISLGVLSLLSIPFIIYSEKLLKMFRII